MSISTYPLEPIRIKIHGKSAVHRAYIQPIVMNHRMEDNTVRFYVSLPVIIQVVMKNTGLYIVAGKPSMMRADIQTVPLSVIRNAFQVILQYGITVTCSEIFKGSCFTIHEVQSSPFSTNPDVSFFIFRQIPDKRIIQAFLPQRVIRIMSEYFPFRIKIVHTSIIGSYPYGFLCIYINRENRRM